MDWLWIVLLSLPEPHGHGSLRPIDVDRSFDSKGLALSLTAVACSLIGKSVIAFARNYSSYDCRAQSMHAMLNRATYNNHAL